MRRWIAVVVVVTLLLAVVAWWMSRPPRPRPVIVNQVATVIREEDPPQDTATVPPVVEAAPGPSGEALPDEVADDDDGPTSAELLARQAGMEAREDLGAVCRIDRPLRSARGYLAVGAPADFNGRIVPVILGHAYLMVLDGAGEGLLSVAGYAPVKVRWTAATDDGPGRCLPDPVPLEAGGTTITGTVTHQGTGEPARGSWVEGCGGLGFTDDEGIFVMEVVAGPCEVMAMRQDGMLRTLSPPVAVSPRLGDDTVVDLQIPGYPRAGLGLSIAENPAGFAVLDVVENSGGAAAGLLPGDVVVAIDGKPAAETSLEEFIELAGGREGTSVELLVERDGEQQVIEVERKPLRR